MNYHDCNMTGLELLKLKVKLSLKSDEDF